MYDQITLVGTVGSGASTSGEMTAIVNTAEPLGMRDIIGLQTPATVTGTSVGFVGNFDGGTSFYGVNGVGGTAVDVKIAGTKAIALDPSALSGLSTVKINCGSAQAQSTVFQLIARRLV